jgi:cytochrome P450
VTTDVQTGDETVSLHDPYPYFARKRRQAGVFRGTVMDYSKTPESLRPKREYSVVSFDAVNTAFRDGRVFSSAPYDKTIGLFMGPTILAMGGKKHRDHRNPVSAAFKSKALARWEPTVVGPICNAVDRRVHRNRRDRPGPPIRLRIPTRVIAQLLGLPADDLPMFRKHAVALISYHVDYERAFEASAALKDYFIEQIEQRKSKPTETSSATWSPRRSTAKSSATRRFTPCCACCARRAGDHIPAVGKPAISAAHLPGSVRGGAGRP